MIINFSVQNFGPIKDKQVLSFEADKSEHLEDYYIIKTIKGLRLLKLGLIYGPNASGKSTILLALDFLRNLIVEPLQKKNDVLSFSPFLFDKDTPTQNTIFSIDFIQKDVRYYYEVELNNKSIICEELKYFNPNKAIIYKRTTDQNSQFSKIIFGSKIEIDKTLIKTLESNTLWNNTVLGGFLKTNIESKELKNVSDWFLDYLHPIILPEIDLSEYVTSNIGNSRIKKEYVLNILKKADFNISDIKLKKVEKEIPSNLIEFIEKQASIPREKINELKEKRKFITSELESFQHTVNNEIFFLPANLESAGTKRYYGLAGILSMLVNDSVAISIDELEESLHPDLYFHFLLSFLINSKNSQIIATTHNRELLNNKDIFRNDAIWFTDKSKDSATDLYSLSDFDCSVIRNTSSVYNAYKIGKLGAIPNLGDFYLD